MTFQRISNNYDQRVSFGKGQVYLVSRKLAMVVMMAKEGFGLIEV